VNIENLRLTLKSSISQTLEEEKASLMKEYEIQIENLRSVFASEIKELISEKKKLSEFEPISEMDQIVELSQVNPSIKIENIDKSYNESNKLPIRKKLPRAITTAYDKSLASELGINDNFDKKGFSKEFSDANEITSNIKINIVKKIKAWPLSKFISDIDDVAVLINEKYVDINLLKTIHGYKRFKDEIFEIKFFIKDNQINIVGTICNSDENSNVKESIEISKLCDLFNHISYKDLLPLTVIIRNIQSFEEIFVNFIFPFIQIVYEESKESFSLEIFSQSSGIISEDNSQLRFLNQTYNFGFHYVKENDFKIILFSNKDGIRNDLTINMFFDQTSFQKIFKIIDIKNKENLENNLYLTSFETLTTQNLKIFEDAISDLAEIISSEFPNKTLEEISIQNQYSLIGLTVLDSCNNQILVFVKDFPKYKFFEIKANCVNFTKIIPNKSVKLTLTYKYKYENIWKEFGVDKEFISKQELIALLSIVVKRLNIIIPKYDEYINKDEVEINLEPLREVSYYRGVIKKEYSFPYTFTLQSFKDKLIGIKCCVYSATNKKDEGAYLLVDNNYWLIDKEEMKNIPKKKSYLRDQASDYSKLPYFLTKKGFNIISSQIKMFFTSKNIKRVYFENRIGPFKVGNLETIINQNILLDENNV